MKTLFGLAASLLFVSFSIYAQAPAQPDLGIVSVNSGQVWLFTTVASLPADIAVFAQYPGKHGQPVCCRRLKLKNPPELVQAPVSDENTSKPIYRYAAGDTYGDIKSPFLGVAVLGVPLIKKQQGPWFSFASAGLRYEAGFCLSSEGMKVQLVFNGEPIADLYYGLGYAVVPTCN